MKSPKTPQQLADAIESLVADFVDESRRAAEQALQRSFARVSPVSKKSSRARVVSVEPDSRRSASELEELAEKLYEIVCARPGEKMGVFAEELGVASPSLRRPMSRLKAEGRVRCVGDRGMARYFPAVGRRSRGS